MWQLHFSWNKGKQEQAVHGPITVPLKTLLFGPNLMLIKDILVAMITSWISKTLQNIRTCHFFLAYNSKSMLATPNRQFAHIP